MWHKSGSQYAMHIARVKGRNARKIQYKPFSINEKGVMHRWMFRTIEDKH
jgi:hypothetical protein